MEREKQSNPKAEEEEDHQSKNSNKKRQLLDLDWNLGTMCPSSPVSPSSPPEDIGINSTDEELVTCLDRMISGDPIPANVITEVNPYDILPWLLLDESLYFNSYELKATETGYWKATDEDYKIFTNCTTIGSRTTLQFYTGQAPNEKKTNWMMHAYRINPERLLEINKEQDSSSLCRVFLNHVLSPNHEHEQEQQRGAGGEHEVNNKSVSLISEENNQQCGSDGGDINDKSVSLNSEENQQSGAGGHDFNDKYISMRSEENNQSIIHPTSRRQVISRDNEHEPYALFERDVRELNPDYSTQAVPENYDFSRGDFFELKDFVDRDSPSSMSENSSSLTMSSDDYFDSDALLRDIEADQGLQRKTADDNLSVPGVLRPTPVAMSENSSSPTMSSDDYFDSDALLRDIEADQGLQRKTADDNLSVPGVLRPTPVAIREESSGAEQRVLDALASNNAQNRQNVGEVNESSPKSSESETGSWSSTKPNYDRASPAAGESEAIVGRSRSRSRSRMTKLKKKYCCLGPC